MRKFRNKILFSLAMCISAMLTSCLDADNGMDIMSENLCSSSAPAVDISLYRVLTKDSFDGITLTELGAGESIRYDSLAIVTSFLQGSQCPGKEEAVDSTVIVSLSDYDASHPAYSSLNDMMEVVLESDQAIYPVSFDEYSPGNENQFVILLTNPPAEAGLRQFGIWYDGRLYQLTQSVNLLP